MHQLPQVVTYLPETFLATDNSGNTRRFSNFSFSSARIPNRDSQWFQWFMEHGDRPYKALIFVDSENAFFEIYDDYEDVKGDYRDTGGDLYDIRDPGPAHHYSFRSIPRSKVEDWIEENIDELSDSAVTAIRGLLSSQTIGAGAPREKISTTISASTQIDALGREGAMDVATDTSEVTLHNSEHLIDRPLKRKKNEGERQEGKTFSREQMADFIYSLTYSDGGKKRDRILSLLRACNKSMRERQLSKMNLGALYELAGVSDDGRNDAAFFCLLIREYGVLSWSLASKITRIVGFDFRENGRVSVQKWAKEHGIGFVKGGYQRNSTLEAWARKWEESK